MVVGVRGSAVLMGLIRLIHKGLVWWAGLQGVGGGLVLEELVGGWSSRGWWGVGPQEVGRGLVLEGLVYGGCSMGGWSVGVGPWGGGGVGTAQHMCEVLDENHPQDQRCAQGPFQFVLISAFSISVETRGGGTCARQRWRLTASGVLRMKSGGELRARVGSSPSCRSEYRSIPLTANKPRADARVVHQTGSQGLELMHWKAEARAA